MNNQSKIKLGGRESLLLIAGLGNPGDKYIKTRHNAGFLFLDLLAEKLGESWRKDAKLKCQIIKSGNLILIKPSTFMNNSGESLQKVMSYYKMLPTKLCLRQKNSDLSENLLVVHDELDINFSKHKFSTNSRPAGNNGVASIIQDLKTKNFTRLRVGIKTDLLKHVSAKDFVLQRFTKEEMIQLDQQYKNLFDQTFSI